MNENVKINSDKTIFGFWMYLMSDFVLFAALFATFEVLRVQSVFSGFGGTTIFNGPFVLTETIILLTSSFVCGIAMLAARRGVEAKKWLVLTALAVTAILGAVFVTMELSEFSGLVAAGNSWQQSGFLSAYFTLVGTHGLHIIIGLVWVIALMISITRRGLTEGNMRKLMLWSMFWHFLDLVWIFIFTIVYLLGVI